jgi:nitrate reductase gamma subunit
MTSEALLTWARGPGFDVALAIFVLGMLLRLFEIISLGNKPDLAEGRGSGVVGGLKTIITRNWPRGTVFAREPVRIINGYVFHLGFFIVLFFYGPHIELFQTKLGLSWPGLPTGVIDAVAVITVASLVLALVMRLTSPVLKQISSVGDYVAWAATLLPVLTGYLAYNHMLVPYTQMLALHLLSVELLLIVAPFTKLTHMFSFVLSRWYQGYQAGHRGIES